MTERGSFVAFSNHLQKRGRENFSGKVSVMLAFCEGQGAKPDLEFSLLLTLQASSNHQPFLNSSA